METSPEAIVDLGDRAAHPWRIGRRSLDSMKKADVPENREGLGHVGLLLNRLPGNTGVPFDESPDSYVFKSSGVAFSMMQTQRPR